MCRYHGCLTANNSNSKIMPWLMLDSTKIVCFRVQSASLSAAGEASSLTLGTPFWETLAHGRVEGRTWQYIDWIVGWSWSSQCYASYAFMARLRTKPCTTYLKHLVHRKARKLLTVPLWICLTWQRWTFICKTLHHLHFPVFDVLITCTVHFAEANPFIYSPTKEPHTLCLHTKYLDAKSIQKQWTTRRVVLLLQASLLTCWDTRRGPNRAGSTPSKKNRLQWNEFTLQAFPGSLMAFSFSFISCFLIGDSCINFLLQKFAGISRDGFGGSPLFLMGFLPCARQWPYVSHMHALVDLNDGRCPAFNYPWVRFFPFPIVRSTISAATFGPWSCERLALSWIPQSVLETGLDLHIMSGMPFLHIDRIQCKLVPIPCERHPKQGCGRVQTLKYFRSDLLPPGFRAQGFHFQG